MRFLYRQSNTYSAFKIHSSTFSEHLFLIPWVQDSEGSKAQAGLGEWGGHCQEWGGHKETEERQKETESGQSVGGPRSSLT